MRTIKVSENPPVLMFYREILAGDVRKLEARSNDSDSGGGARDIRVPEKAFGAFMRRIFTRDAVMMGRDVWIADITYKDAEGKHQLTELVYWPPTSARPTEERIGRIHASPALGGNLPDADKECAFIVLIKFADSTVVCRYVYELDLRGGKWAPEVANQILGCLASARDRGTEKRPVPAMGYYDFEEGVGYCHADRRRA